MKAVIETGGKQYYVEKGSVIYIEKLDNNIGEEISFPVLAIDTKVGTPYLDNAKVTGIVEKHGKAKKIIVFKYRPKERYRKKQGHRQPYTKITITDIAV